FFCGTIPTQGVMACGYPYSLVAMHSLPDYLQPGLRLVFVGFNPSMRSAAVGHYYAGPGNLFWPLLYESGFLPAPLTYAEDARILEFGIGLTDLVQRPTHSSAELAPGEARAGVSQLQTKLATYTPRVVCFNGKGVYAWYMNRAVDLGPQNDTIGAAHVFVVPSTSARNGRWQRRDKAAYFQALRHFVDRCA
ncbi:MAG TPA: mismatch-specific DNA-glycosylase, partial [Candidatus Tectomicrobia bacterium]